jgi:uncharacterized protein with HEPN domain
LSQREAASAAIASARAEIRRIRQWVSGKDLDDLKMDEMRLYAVERAFMALAAALRDIPEALIASSDLDIRPAIGFRNVLAHSYGDILDGRVIATIRDDLPQLDDQLLKLAARIAD